MCARTHGGWAHRQRVSTTYFWLGRIQKEMYSWRDSYLSPLDLESDTLPIEPPSHPNTKHFDYHLYLPHCTTTHTNKIFKQHKNITASSGLTSVFIAMTDSHPVPSCTRTVPVQGRTIRACLSNVLKVNVKVKVTETSRSMYVMHVSMRSLNVIADILWVVDYTIKAIANQSSLRH